MTKNEFMAQLAAELNKRNIADAADILEEYEQHFAFKLADGFMEEEIAARLGDPIGLAAQFGPTPQKEKRPSAVLTWLWLAWGDLFYGLFAILLLAWGLVMVSAALSFGLVGICYIGDLGRLPFITLPYMPYWCGAILGLSMLALCALTAAGCVWFFAFLRQLLRSYGRFHRNALAPAHGKAILPALPIAPQFSPRGKRRLRGVALVALALFAVCFILTYVACSLSAGSPEFWHTWGWFGY